MLALGGSSVRNMASLWVSRRAVKVSHAIWHAKNILHFRNVTFVQKDRKEESVPQTSHQSTTWTSRTSDNSQTWRISSVRPRRWKPNCSHLVPGRWEWTRVTLCHFLQRLVLFAPLLLFKQLRPQKPYRMLQSGKAPSHRVGADGNPRKKSKHRFTLIRWLTDITVSHRRYRSTSYSPVWSLTKAGLTSAFVVRQHKQDDEQS